MVEIRLSWAQMMLAAHVGAMRQVSNVKHHRKPFNGAPEDQDWQMHIESCAGEMAVAMHFNLFWDGKLDDLSPGDAGKLEVRTTSRKNGRLILHDGKDANASRFVHVVGLNGCYRLIGWCYGHEGKKADYWADPTGNNRPAYFVPNRILRPLHTLIYSKEEEVA